MKALLWIQENFLRVLGWAVLAFFLILSVGCSTHGQHFTEYHPDGSVKFDMDIRHYTLFMNSEAAKLQVETQMEEFIFNVNADQWKQSVDTNFIRQVIELAEEINKLKTPIP